MGQCSRDRNKQTVRQRNKQRENQIQRPFYRRTDGTPGAASQQSMNTVSLDKQNGLRTRTNEARKDDRQEDNEIKNEEKS